MNTTIETLDKLGQRKVWKAESWSTLNEVIDKFINFMKAIGKRGTLVLDSGSVVKPWWVDMKEKAKGDKSLAPFEHEPFKMEFRNILKKIVVENGHNCIMTLYLKANYTPNLVEGNKIVSYGAKDGTYSPQEWEELLYHCNIAMQLERGFVDNGKRYFEYKVFNKIRKTRGLHEEYKPYLVPPFTIDNVLRQLSAPYYNPVSHILAEIYKITDDPRLKKDLNKMYEGKEEWAKLTGQTILPPVDPKKVNLI